MKTFQKQVVTHQLTLLVAVSLAIVFWTIALLLHPMADLRETIGAFALYAIVGYLLIVLNKTFAIIRLRASIQTVIFLVLAAILPDTHLIYPGIIMTLCYLVGLFFFFNSYQLERPAGLLFHAFIFWGISSLFVPKIIWLFPFIWYACFTFRSLSVKSFIASLFGWSLPIGVFAAYAFWKGDFSAFTNKVIEAVAIEIPTSLDFLWPFVVTLFYLLIIFIVSSAHSLKTSLDEKVQARNYLHHIITVTVVLFILIGTMPSDYELLLPLMVMNVSILYGHFSAIANTKWSNIFFICSLVCLVPVFIVNLLF